MSEAVANAIEDARISYEWLVAGRKRARRGLISYLKRLRSERRRLAGIAAQEHRAAIDSIRAVEESYLKQMTLQAPVSYWKARGAAHSKKYRNMVWVASIYAVFASIALAVGGFGFLRLEVARLAEMNVPREAVLIEITLFLMIATVVFWVGRVISKIMLSERHLATDATERAVMAETYLALLHDGAVADAERPLVLNALFRASPDGVVKDDGGGDASVAALLARALTPSPGR
jgi:large-conductance mechanosensitive channel